MATPATSPHLHQKLFARLAEARAITDAIFPLVRPEALYDRPIPERHRLIFYIGHLEAFDWNLIGRGACGLEPFRSDFDQLFSFGIDPTDGNLPTDQPKDWPRNEEIQDYNARVREELEACLRGPMAVDPSRSLLADGTLLHMAIEHRLMHAETLAYLLRELALEKKTPQEIPRDEAAAQPAYPRQVIIPEGIATLGQRRVAGSFGWDNEFEEQQVTVPSFAIDALPVMNGQFLEFIRAGGYDDRSLWSEEDWNWRTAQGISHPRFWVRRDDSWNYRAMFAKIPLPLTWPVYVSHAEACAYARWAGKKLPTEAQWHRAAYGTPQGTECAHPWGEEEPAARHGNFDFRSWDATPVNGHPEGASAFGVWDLVGNGWEWTATPFGPLPGFQPFPFYPGFSANFFDGRHFVMKGGSSRTAVCMLRRPFRNWFQPHYPYVFGKFRSVED
jgi:ergothioneine biosynthesis protein EgtB